MNLIIFGFQSCGKTHFGKRLAKLTHQNLIDTDLMIEKLGKQIFNTDKITCREIAFKKGIDFFRELEKEVIFSIPYDYQGIISVGGGAVIDSENRTKLSKLGQLVYLEADKDFVKKKIFSGPLPAYLDPQDPEESFNQIYEIRTSIYEKIDAIKITINDKSEQEVLTAIKEIHLQEHTV